MPLAESATGRSKLVQDAAGMVAHPGKPWGAVGHQSYAVRHGRTPAAANTGSGSMSDMDGQGSDDIGGGMPSHCQSHCHMNPCSTVN